MLLRKFNRVEIIKAKEYKDKIDAELDGQKERAVCLNIEDGEKIGVYRLKVGTLVCGYSNIVLSRQKMEVIQRLDLSFLKVLEITARGIIFELMPEHTKLNSRHEIWRDIFSAESIEDVIMGYEGYYSLDSFKDIKIIKEK